MHSKRTTTAMPQQQQFVPQPPAYQPSKKEHITAQSFTRVKAHYANSKNKENVALCEAASIDEMSSGERTNDYDILFKNRSMIAGCLRREEWSNQCAN
jgi:hypothetical protein